MALHLSVLWLGTAVAGQRDVRALRGDLRPRNARRTGAVLPLRDRRPVPGLHVRLPARGSGVHESPLPDRAAVLPDDLDAAAAGLRARPPAASRPAGDGAAL